MLNNKLFVVNKNYHWLKKIKTNSSFCGTIRPMNKTFGEYIKELRGQRTKKEIAQKAGFTAEYIRRIEEENKIPSQEILIKLAKGLGVDEKKLIFNALQADAPVEIKEYFEFPSCYYTHAAKNLPNFFFIPPFPSPTEQLNSVLLKSFIFRLEDNILDGFAYKNQKVITSFANEYTKNDFVVLEINQVDGKYTKQLKEYRKGFPEEHISVTQGLDYLAGKVVSNSNENLKLANTKFPNKEIVIHKNDISQGLLIIGILF